MFSVFMGPYPSRLERVRRVSLHPATSVVLGRPARALGIKRSADALCTAPSLLPRCSRKRHDIPLTSAAPSAPTKGAMRALVLRVDPTATQLSTLPTAWMTQLILWRQSRTSCTSALPLSCPPPTRRQPPPRVALIVVRLSDAPPSDIVAATARREADTTLTVTGPRWAPFAEDNGRGRTLKPTAGTAAAAVAAGAGAAARPGDGGCLHTSRRHYGTGGVADPDGPSGVHAHTGPDTQETEAVAACSFEEIHLALMALHMVDAEGRVVRAWTQAEVKRAYRALAKELHPDVAGGDSAEMESVNAAYACLVTLPAEVQERFVVWLQTGGEASLLERQSPMLRWASRDVAQLMMVGWCTTFSGLAMYASWRMLRGSTAQATSTATLPNRGGADREKGVGRAGRPTLPRAGAAMSTASAVHYGVVSSGSSFLESTGLSWHGVQLVRVMVTRYALAVALTVAACVNTLMIQRVLARLITGTS